jgi:hypothetical protein
VSRWRAALFLAWVVWAIWVAWAPAPVHSADDEASVTTVRWPANGGGATGVQPALPHGLSVVEHEAEGISTGPPDLAEGPAPVGESGWVDEPAAAEVLKVGGAPPGEPAPVPAAAGAATVDLPNGRFFATGEGGTGYAILDEPGGPPFWTAFQHLGGAERLGLPVSRPFLLPDARVYQATQVALLVWQPGAAEAEISAALDLMSAAGLDDWLWERGIPRPLPEAREPVRGLAQVTGNVVARLAWLTEPAFLDAYYAAEAGAAGAAATSGVVRYGLPASRPEQFSTHVTQRFQRGAMRLHPGATADADAGSAATAATPVPVPVGELLRESGLLAAALAPDRVVGGQLVARAPRPQLAWRSDTGWGVEESAAAVRSAPVPAALAGPQVEGAPLPGAAAAGSGVPPASGAGTGAPGNPTATAGTPAAQRPPATATATATPTALLQPGATIVVRAIVNQGRAEHVVIANEGSVAQNLGGWTLRSATGGQTFTFPAGISLSPGASLKVHSGSGNPSTLNRPPSDLFATSSNVWRNTGDTAELLDPSGRLVHRRSYGSP